MKLLITNQRDYPRTIGLPGYTSIHIEALQTVEFHDYTPANREYYNKLAGAENGLRVLINNELAKPNEVVPALPPFVDKAPTGWEDSDTEGTTVTPTPAEKLTITIVPDTMEAPELSKGSNTYIANVTDSKGAVVDKKVNFTVVPSSAEFTITPDANNGNKAVISWSEKVTNGNYKVHAELADDATVSIDSSLVLTKVIPNVGGKLILLDSNGKALKADSSTYSVLPGEDVSAPSVDGFTPAQSSQKAPAGGGDLTFKYTLNAGSLSLAMTPATASGTTGTAGSQKLTLKVTAPSALPDSSVSVDLSGTTSGLTLEDNKDNTYDLSWTADVAAGSYDVVAKAAYDNTVTSKSTLTLAAK